MLQDKSVRLYALLALVGAAVLFAGASDVLALEQSHTASIPLDVTNWSDNISVPQFNPTLGCLDSVCFVLDGHVEGTSKFESLDGAPATITTDLAAELELQRPSGTPLVTTIPLAQTSEAVDAFDTVIDFGGLSGRTYENLSADKSESACTASLQDMLLFSGLGNITLPVVATGASTGSGAGNLILQFSTSASASIRVTYYYHECVVPTVSSTWGGLKDRY